MGQVNVSIIIVNYNTLHVLRPCLDSIVEQTKDINYEIIVVDNGSTDGSIEALSKDQRLTFIATGENLGFGRVRQRFRIPMWRRFRPDPGSRVLLPSEPLRWRQ